MLDVSDGLALDAGRVAEASGVRIELHSEALGPDPATALSGGEDHALLACFPSEASVPHPFRVIGAVLPNDKGDERRRVSVDGRPYDGRAGWDPYSGWDGAAG